MSGTKPRADGRSKHRKILLRVGTCIRQEQSAASVAVTVLAVLRQSVAGRHKVRRKSGVTIGVAVASLACLGQQKGKERNPIEKKTMLTERCKGLQPIVTGTG
jgi:hypothetical protein